MTVDIGYILYLRAKVEQEQNQRVLVYLLSALGYIFYPKAAAHVAVDLQCWSL